MASQQELRDFLRDHLSYERAMLEFTFAELAKPHEQSMWNALFESFAVHARLLYAFLRSQEKGGINATDYAEKLKTDPLGSTLLINQSIFHALKGRVDGARYDMDDATEAHKWIVREWRRWVGNLPPHFASVLNDPPRAVQVTVGAPSATNAITVISSTK